MRFRDVSLARFLGSGFGDLFGFGSGVFLVLGLFMGLSGRVCRSIGGSIYENVCWRSEIE